FTRLVSREPIVVPAFSALRLSIKPYQDSVTKLARSSSLRYCPVPTKIHVRPSRRLTAAHGAAVTGRLPAVVKSLKDTGGATVPRSLNRHKLPRRSPAYTVSKNPFLSASHTSTAERPLSPPTPVS